MFLIFYTTHPGILRLNSTPKTLFPTPPTSTNFPYSQFTMKTFACVLALAVGFAFADGPIESTCSEWELWNPQPQVWYLQGHCLDNNGKSVCSHASLDA